MHKATEAKNTSHLSRDSSEASGSIIRRRKRQMPARYRRDLPGSEAKRQKILDGATDSSGSENESFMNANKMHSIPHLSVNNQVEMGGNTSKPISNSQSHSSKNQDILQSDPTSTALYNCMFLLLENMNKRIGAMEDKLNHLISIVEKSVNSSNETTPLDYLPEDVILPVTSVEELNQLNEKLKKDKAFSAVLVRFLYNAGSGRSKRSFILSLTKRLLSQDVAIQFSRFGRKGKKSFVNFNETLSVILAAASMKFKEAEREDLAEMFGRSLAGASDWNRRKCRPSDTAVMNCSLSFTEADQ